MTKDKQPDIETPTLPERVRISWRWHPIEEVFVAFDIGADDGETEYVRADLAESHEATITELQKQVETLRKASRNVLKVQLATKPPISPAPLNSGAGQSEAAYKLLRDILGEGE